MRFRRLLLMLAAVVLAVLATSFTVRAQQVQQAPELIVHNAKVVTVDDHALNDKIGTIAQAIAISGDKILAVGTNSQIRGMAGPNTKQLDLKGRMVLPGFAATHDHPMDWDPLNPYIVKKVISDDMHIERFVNVPPDQVMPEFNKVLQEAVQKAKPGQWVRISLLYGPDYKWADQIFPLLGKEINKDLLDKAAPNNPVIVRGGFVGGQLNQQAIDRVRQHYGKEWDKFNPNPFGAMVKTGSAIVDYRYVEQDVLYQRKALKEIYRLGLNWMGGYGVTVNSSALYTGGALQVYSELDREKQLDIRFPYAFQWQLRNDFWADPYLPSFLAAQVGQGSDYMWLAGLWPGFIATDCSTRPGLRPEVKKREQPCNFDPGSPDAIAMYNMIKAGGRLVGIHTGFDRDIDNILDIIEKASKDAGFTPAQVRAKRHTYDHLGMSPRPDQLPRIKNLGMALGGWNMYIWEGQARRILEDYGEEGATWVVPRKSIRDAGIWQSMEIDRPIGYTNLTYFTVMYAGITRKDAEGRVNAPSEAVSREAMLKSATLGGAIFSMREDKLGSIEPGKLADLVVIDRDYLTVPVDDIQNIRVLMTIVGGRTIHLVPSLAKELGMPPTGAQVELGGPAAKW